MRKAEEHFEHGDVFSDSGDVANKRLNFEAEEGGLHGQGNRGHYVEGLRVSTRMHRHGHELRIVLSTLGLKLKQLDMDNLLNMDFEDFQAWLDAGGDYIRPAAVAPVVHPDGAGGDAGDHFVAPVAPPPVAPAVPVAPPPVAPAVPVVPPHVAPVAPVVPPHVAPVAPLEHPGGGGGDADDYIRPAAVAPLEHPGGGGGDAAVYLEDHAYAAALVPVAPAPAAPVVPVVPGPMVPLAPMVRMVPMAPMAPMVPMVHMTSRLCGRRTHMGLVWSHSWCFKIIGTDEDDSHPPRREHGNSAFNKDFRSLYFFKSLTFSSKLGNDTNLIVPR
ncbi:hypothetical protein WMY93_027213 [Mugilogobius chulae]|uniref:Uncharacterized protein n=1 Tax=Mugilogobius chulae TaxID=88201 RepID=A0AAW0N178_9GOBI